VGGYAWGKKEDVVNVLRGKKIHRPQNEGSQPARKISEDSAGRGGRRLAGGEENVYVIYGNLEEGGKREIPDRTGGVY